VGQFARGKTANAKSCDLSRLIQDHGTNGQSIFLVGETVLSSLELTNTAEPIVGCDNKTPLLLKQWLTAAQLVAWSRRWNTRFIVSESTSGTPHCTAPCVGQSGKLYDLGTF
jgi:hypothetical protein